MCDRSRSKIVGVTLTYEKLAQERFPRIEDPMPAEVEYVHTPRSHMIKKADLTKAGGWTLGCRMCKAMKEGDQSQTNLVHSAECTARVAGISADDVEFRTKMQRAEERKEGACRAMESFPKVQIGGSTSCGAPVDVTTHPSSPDKDIVMEGVDVEIPMSVKGIKRNKEGDLEVDEGVATKVPLTTSVGTKRGRSSSCSSSSTSSSSDSSSQVEVQKIDGEGDAVMHMNNSPEQHLPNEYKLSISTKGEKRDETMTTRRDKPARGKPMLTDPDKPASGNREHVHEKDRRDQSVYDAAEIFSPPRVCRRARIRGLRGGWSLDDSAMCPVTGRTWDLLNSQEQKRAWNLFHKAKPKLLAASPPLLVLAKVEMAVKMCLAQHEAGRKFVFEHPASASSWNFPSLRRLAEI